MLAPANNYFFSQDLCFFVCLQPVKMLHTAPLNLNLNVVCRVGPCHFAKAASKLSIPGLRCTTEEEKWVFMSSHCCGQSACVLLTPCQRRYNYWQRLSFYSDNHQPVGASGLKQVIKWHLSDSRLSTGSVTPQRGAFCFKLSTDERCWASADTWQRFKVTCDQNDWAEFMWQFDMKTRLIS